MTSTTDHRQETRARILASARHLFNRNGLSEVSIDTIMTGAGLTRGAFYSYFPSKDELYAEAITTFARDAASEPWRCAMTDRQPLARAILDAYLSRAHLDDVEGSCPLIGLPTDTARSSPTVKAAYREILEMMVGMFAADLGSAERDRALGIAALCVGGMVLARAVDDSALADDLRQAAHKLAVSTAGWGDRLGEAAPPPQR